MHGRGLKGRWLRLNDFCSKYGYFKYLRLMNFIQNGISISVWLGQLELGVGTCHSLPSVGQTSCHGSVILKIVFCFTDIMMDL